MPSWRGNNYVLVSVYRGYVFGVAMPSRKGPDYVKAYEATFTRFASLDYKPAIQRLDNETSGVLERFFRNIGVTVQFVPANYPGQQVSLFGSSDGTRRNAVPHSRESCIMGTTWHPGNSLHYPNMAGMIKPLRDMFSPSG